MSVMTIPEAWYAQDRTLTVEDMENMPDDEFRYELDDGVLIVSPAPTNWRIPFPVTVVPSRLVTIG